MLADVVLPSRRFQVFTYQVPSHFFSNLHVGSAVVVPLGSSQVSGLVVSLFEKQQGTPLQGSFHHKPLRAILSVEVDSHNVSLEHSLFQLIKKISEYYVAPLAACLRLIVPPHSVRVIRRVFLTEEGRMAILNPSPSAENQVVLRKLERAPNGLLRSSLIRLLPNASAILTNAKKKGWIIERTTTPNRFNPEKQRSAVTQGKSLPSPSSRGLFDLSDPESKEASEPLWGTPRDFDEENLIWREISRAVDTGRFHEISAVGSEPWRQDLLLQSVQYVCRQQRTILVLTPEVHQAETLARHLRSILKDQVEVYHGHLSSTLRSARWESIRQGQVQVVVGTRSALFLPLPKLGLIWIDHEHDPSYKDEHLPYFHAREVARMLGQIGPAVVVYGATYPSLETYQRFREQMSFSSTSSGPKAYHVEVVDLRTLPYGTILSPVLQTSMTRALDEGHQVILILDRKGFSPSLICHDCGQAPSCSRCGVPLKLFQRPSRLLCSICAESQSTPETCPNCQGTIFRFSGTGTQRLEEEVGKLFPSFPVGRFDRENIKTFQEAGNMLDRFRQKDIRVLIGTEYLLHQSELPNARVIGLPQADLGLNIPDFRAAERIFQKLSKAVSLAQYDSRPAEVILQTRLPDHHVIKAIHEHNPLVFYDQELELRNALGYPPATHIFLLVVSGTQEARVQRVVEFLSQRLGEWGMSEVSGQKEIGEHGLSMVLGPIPSKKPGRMKKNRVIFLIKTNDLQETQRRIWNIQSQFNGKFSKDAVVCEVNVDPTEIQ